MKISYLYVKTLFRAVMFGQQINDKFSATYPTDSYNLLDINIDEVRKICNESDVLIFSDFYCGYDVKGDACRSYEAPKYKPQEFFNEVYNCILESTAKKLYFAYTMDLHNSSITQSTFWTQAISSIDALAWYYEKGAADWHNIPTQYKDYWMNADNESYGGGVNPINNYNYIIKNIPIRIEFPFAVAPNNFINSKKIWDVCVPGTNYATRQLAINSFKNNKLGLAPYELADKIITKTWLKLTPQLPKLNKYFYAMRRKNMSFFVSRSKVNFVCGSGIRYPVLKFFEIPACHSALLAYPFLGMESLGFKNETNALFTTPEEAGKDANFLLKNHTFRTKIIENASTMIAENHSIEKRVKDLYTCASLLGKDKLKGAQFIDGEYNIEQG